MASVQPRNDISLLESRTDEGICSGIFTVVLTLFSLILVICTFPFSLCVCVRMVQVYTLKKYYLPLQQGRQNVKHFGEDKLIWWA